MAFLIYNPPDALKTILIIGGVTEKAFSLLNRGLRKIMRREQHTLVMYFAKSQ